MYCLFARYSTSTCDLFKVTTLIKSLRSGSLFIIFYRIAFLNIGCYQSSKLNWAQFFYISRSYHCRSVFCLMYTEIISQGVPTIMSLFMYGNK